MPISTFGVHLMKGGAKLIDIKDFPDLGGTPELLEVTTLSDESQEYIEGIQSADALEFKANYTREDYENLVALKGERHPYAVYFGENGENGKFEFEGYLSVRVLGGGVNEVVSMAISIAPATPITSPVEEILIPTEGLAYELSEDGTYYTCTGIGTATDTDIIIPDYYEGLPVKYLAVNAFGRDVNVTSIILPRTLETAYGGSLSSDTLKKVVVRTLGDSIREISGSEFLKTYADYIWKGNTYSSMGVSAFVYAYRHAEDMAIVEDDTPGANCHTNTTIEEVHFTWAETEDVLNSYSPWSLANANIIYESEEALK